MQFDKQRDPKIIIEEGDINRLVELADTAGAYLVQKNLTTSQIRNIFGEVRSIEANWSRDPDAAFRRVALLEPKLAYAVGRGQSRDGNPVKELADLLTPCLTLIRKAPAEKRKDYFDRFSEFFEAILAYHRRSGGKTS